MVNVVDRASARRCQRSPRCSLTVVEKDSLLTATRCRDWPLPRQTGENALSNIQWLFCGVDLRLLGVLRAHFSRAATNIWRLWGPPPQAASVPTNRSTALIAGALIKME